MRKIFIALFLIICVSFVLSGCLKKIEKMPCCLRLNATVQNICVLEDGTVFKKGGVGTEDNPTTVTCDPDILKLNLTCNVSKGPDQYELYPICTEREFSPCEMNNCTTMLCGSFKFKPELVISPSASTYNRDKLEEEAKKSGIATGLLNGMCVFIPYDGSLGEIMQKSRGSYINTFRIGINGGTAGYPTYEKLRLLFPISDKLCNINPFGSVDRYMNYLVPPYAVDTTQLLTVYDPIKDFEKEKYLKSPYKKPFQTTSYLGADGTYKFFYGNVESYAGDYYDDILKTYYSDVFVDRKNFMSLYKDKNYPDMFIDYSFYIQALRYMYHGYTVVGSKTGKAPYECESALDCHSTNCDLGKYKREVCRKSDGSVTPCECRLAYDGAFQSNVVRCKPVGLKNLKNAGSNTASGYLPPSYDMIQKFDKYYQYVYDDVYEGKPLEVVICSNFYNKTAEKIFDQHGDPSVLSFSRCYKYAVSDSNKGYQFVMDDIYPDQFDYQYQKNFRKIWWEDIMGFPQKTDGSQYTVLSAEPHSFCTDQCTPIPAAGYSTCFVWDQGHTSKDDIDDTKWIPDGYDPTILFPGMSEMPTDQIIVDHLKALNMNTSIMGVSILTPESFRKTAFVKACNLKENVDYHIFTTKELVPNLNRTLGATRVIQPFLFGGGDKGDGASSDSSSTPCSTVKTKVGTFATFNANNYVMIGTSSAYVTFITNLGDCGKGVASTSDISVDGPVVKNLGICEPCTYATMTSQTVSESDKKSYVYGKTTDYLRQNIIPVIDLSNYDFGIFDKGDDLESYSDYYFDNPAMKTIEENPGPVIIIAGTVSPLYFFTSDVNLIFATLDGTLTVDEYNNFVAISNNEASLARQKLLYRINQIRGLDPDEGCKKCVIALKVMPSFLPYDFRSDRFPARLNNSEKLLDRLFGLSSNYESCIEAAKHNVPCLGQSLINNISLIAFDYYPDEVALDYFADAGYYGEVDENIFVGQMENFSHSMLKKFNTPTFVHTFGIIGAVGDSSDPATSGMTKTNPSSFANSQAGKVYSQVIQKIILKQTNLTNNGIISIMFSANISNPTTTTVSMYDPKLVPVENGTSIISFGRPDTLVLRTDVPVDEQSSRCSICTPLEVAMKKCGITKCANGVECLLRDDAPKASQFCPDSLLPPECKLCTDSVFSGKNIFCNMTYANGSVVKFGPVSFETAGHKDNISIYSDVISSLSDGYRCCAKDDGDKAYSFYKKESTTSMLSPILFSKLGLEDKRCDFMTADPGQFCGMSIALKNYLIECGVK